VLWFKEDWEAVNYHRPISGRVVQLVGCVCVCVCVSGEQLSIELTSFDVDIGMVVHLDHITGQSSRSGMGKKFAGEITTFSAMQACYHARQNQTRI